MNVFQERPSSGIRHFQHVLPFSRLPAFYVRELIVCDSNVVELNIIITTSVFFNPVPKC